MASSLIARVIFFIATVFLSIIIVFSFITMVDKNDVAMKTQQNFLEQKLKTEITIESFAYNDDIDQIILYVRNIGKTSINPVHVDVYIDNDRVDTSSDFSINITEDTNNLNERLWDPQEIVRIVINQTISTNEAHTVLITESRGKYSVVKEQPSITTATY
jgi:archaellum component FlaG (FlaF/FlaG flagellin family)